MESARHLTPFEEAETSAMALLNTLQRAAKNAFLSDERDNIGQRLNEFSSLDDWDTSEMLAEFRDLIETCARYWSEAMTERRTRRGKKLGTKRDTVSLTLRTALEKLLASLDSGELDGEKIALLRTSVREQLESCMQRYPAPERGDKGKRKKKAHKKTVLATTTTATVLEPHSPNQDVRILRSIVGRPTPPKRRRKWSKKKVAASKK